MRIAFILSGFPTLSETFILNQITGMIDRGHDVSIHSLRRVDNSIVHDEVISYRLLERTHYSAEFPSNKIARALGAVRIFQNLKKHRKEILGTLNVPRYGREAASLGLFYSALPWFGKEYDIIQCHFGPVGLAGIRLRELCSTGGKIAVSFHGYDMSTYLRTAPQGVYKPLFAKIDCALPISEHWRDKLIGLGCPAEKILVHRMGVDCDKLAFEPRFGSEGEPVRIVTVARLVEKKGVQFAIRALASLRNQGKRFQYDIVGDGPLKEECLHLIKESGAEDSINLLGWRTGEEVREIVSRSHLFLCPSVTASNGDQEGIPVAIMEAMALGLPVVSTYHSGIPELVKDGETGFLVPERDVALLADRINHLVQHPEIWPAMGSAGRATVEEHYNIHNLNDQLVEIYRGLLDSRQGHV